MENDKGEGHLPDTQQGGAILVMDNNLFLWGLAGPTSPMRGISTHILTHTGLYCSVASNIYAYYHQPFYSNANLCGVTISKTSIHTQA